MPKSKKKTASKDPIAQAMVRKRWEKTTKEQRRKVGRELTRARLRKRREV